MLLTKQEIMVAKDMSTEDVNVAEWGGTVRVRTLTGRERDAFEASLTKMTKGKREADLVNVRAKLVGVCLVDDTGARLFSDSEVAFLGAKSAAALDRVFTVCQRLNGLSAADVEDLEKNSEAGPSESSPSTSV